MPDVPTVCPHCGRRNEFQTSPQDALRPPAPGNISICVQCGNFSIFTGELGLRKPTSREAEALGCDPTFGKIQRAIRANPGWADDH